MLPEEGIEPRPSDEDTVEENAAAAGIGEETPTLHLVAVPPNWRWVLASGGARVLVAGSRVVEGHRGGREGGGGNGDRGCLRR